MDLLIVFVACIAITLLLVCGGLAVHLLLIGLGSLIAMIKASKLTLSRNPKFD